MNFYLDNIQHTKYNSAPSFTVKKK